ncbi:MAG: hypothetical protein KC996_04715 [Phycisphaerales bacterium]|nr:hypothetical protein [Phycisphaerales bacterium]
MDDTTDNRTNSDKPPKQSFHDRKIAELEARKRLAPPQPSPPRPIGAPPPSKQLNAEDRAVNEALDRLIGLWKKEKEKVQGREGQLQEHFRKGKIKGKAKDGFERS